MCVCNRPSGSTATMSVNVPPRSIQNCQRVGVVFAIGMYDFASGCPDKSALIIDKNVNLN
ncbi:MAG: hypothetical protein MJE68_14230 [Proteobacteria bacterium]|nr:hypothetical protein [Pseudomonadota bacterium]